MKEIKEKLSGGVLTENAAGNIPKTALKKAWTEAKEKRNIPMEKQDGSGEQGAYAEADQAWGNIADGTTAAVSGSLDFSYKQGRQLAQKQYEKRKQQRSAEWVAEERAHAATERHVSPETIIGGKRLDVHGSAQRGANLPRKCAREKAATIKVTSHEIRGVSYEQKQVRTVANETVRNITGRERLQNSAQQIKIALQSRAAAIQQKTKAALSAIRHFLESLRSLVTAMIAGTSIAMNIVIIICLVAFVSGSAYGIFFAADVPGKDAISVQEAVETLTDEYRDKLETISDTVQHDRQDIVANDDVYYIRWQDVLAVFSSYVSGNEHGSPVASLGKEQVDTLREIMWAMNEVDYTTRTETTAIETTNDTGQPTRTTITETVLEIELTHKTPAEMAADYHFNTRQSNYLQLLQDPQYEQLWAELLGGYAQGDGEILTPDSTRAPTGTLQWPLPVAGTITSQFGHRVDPITGEVSSHTGTDIACAEGTPILAAAEGTVTVANGLDSWGGSYGYYVQIDHGGGLETLYAHCSSICVTTGQQVQAGQIIGYVGHTGRATGSHLHLEVRINGNRANPLQHFL
ncbi:MAG: M23 family metallopeptidase [Oscillospiraceae bacterium]|nr:MAG: M23 family metallopeptidase [Oscillospiraceae bacterium]